VLDQNLEQVKQREQPKAAYFEQAAKGPLLLFPSGLEAAQGIVRGSRSQSIVRSALSVGSGSDERLLCAWVLGSGRWKTPLGLWWRQVRVASRHPVRAYPDVQAVRTYELLARQSLENRLVRTVRLRGGENEFEALRDYQRDDEYRAIDWKATARRQKLITGEYQQECNQSVLCLLDCGRLMTAESLGLSQLDHALNAVLMLSHVATRAGDQVGLCAFDARVRAYLPPQGGRRAAQRVIAASYDIHAQIVETDFEAAYGFLSQRLRKRSLVVLFTQVVDERLVDSNGVSRRRRTLPLPRAPPPGRRRRGPRGESEG
jgi:uncharacterized protein (DUF58 family)